MIILHYIPFINEKKKSYPAEYVESIIRATSRIAESHVVTEKELGEHFITFRNTFAKKLKELKPDIVHIHASWNFRAAYIEKMARRRGYFTIVSPHGGLSPEIMDLAFWKEKLPRIIGYQFLMTRKCRLVISVSNKEHQELSNLGWKRRIMLVSHPKFSNLSEEDLSSMIMEAYRKVIDTHYTERITNEEKEFVNACLRAATWQEKQYLEEINPIQVTQGMSFRRIYIYAHDNGVTQLLMQGAKVANINMPPRLDVSILPRFKQKAKRQGNYEKKCIKLCKTLHTILPGIDEQVTFTPMGDVSLHTLTQIYCNIRFCDFNEDMLVEELDKLHLTSFFAKMMTQFQSIYHLQTGFMPLINK